MKRIVITGGTRGIGYGLAEAFLARGAAVMINGRSSQSVTQAQEKLARLASPDRIHGCAGSVANLDAVERIWTATEDRWGGVDIWINNAGLGHDMEPAWEAPPERMEAVVRANVLGTMYGSRVAMRGMVQQGRGFIYNMEGFGANGRTRPGMSIYSTTKAAIRQFTRSLIEEAADTPVGVGLLSPGMVITDMLMEPMARREQADQARAKKIFNILADRVEDVTPWLADQILANEKHGAHIRWLTTPKIIWRFLTSPFRERDVLGGADGRA
jgi:NAD(P)-dependent dehydrogenase (short-subunit alcohol dehydrogenase family)